MMQRNWTLIPSAACVDKVKIESPDPQKKKLSRIIIIYQEELYFVDAVKKYMRGLKERITNDSEAVRLLVRGCPLSPSLVQILTGVRQRNRRNSHVHVQSLSSRGEANRTNLNGPTSRTVEMYEGELISLDRFQDYVFEFHLRDICDSHAVRTLVRGCPLSEELILRLHQIRSEDKRRSSTVPKFSGDDTGLL